MSNRRDSSGFALEVDSDCVRPDNAMSRSRLLEALIVIEVTVHWLTVDVKDFFEDHTMSILRRGASS